MLPRRNSIFNRDFSFSWQVARQLQPSVMWIGETEKTFYKRVPNNEKMVRAPPAGRGLGSAVLRAAGEGLPLLPLLLQKALPFQGRKETGWGGPALSLGPKYLSASERTQWADVMRHRLEANEGLCGRRERGAKAPSPASEVGRDLGNSAPLEQIAHPEVIIRTSYCS